MVTNNYKGWTGIYEYDPEYKIYHGQLLNTTDVITFQGDTVATMQQDFEQAVDEYIEELGSLMYLKSDDGCIQA